MKFNCDYFKDKKAARKAKALANFKAAQEWHKVYAWYPIKVGHNDCRCV